MSNDPPRSRFFISHRRADSDSDWEAKFETLLYQYSNSVLSLAFRITGNIQDAEDVAQETFLRCYFGGRHPRSDKPPIWGTWIHRVATNRAIDVLRARRRGEAEVNAGELEVAAPVSVQPDVSLEHRRARDKIADALAALSPDERTAVTLYFLEGFTRKQVEEAGLSSARLKTGVEKLRGRLQDLGPIDLAGEFLDEAEEPPLESPRVPELLQEALVLVDEAKAAEDEVTSDDAAMRLDAILAELFVFRTIGVGFAMIINSLKTALRHRQHFVTDSEWRAMTNVLERLLRGTEISESEAIDHLAELLSSGLVVVPPAIERLIELGGE